MTSYTSEKIEELRALIKMMREEGVCNFTAGDISVAFDVIPTGPKTIEMTTEDKLAILKDELKRQSDDSDADLNWSV
jgi:hypothetical protein